MTDQPAVQQQIEPCPWCGGFCQAVRTEASIYWLVRCCRLSCLAKGPVCNTKANAISEWNRIARAVKQAERYEKALKYAADQQLIEEMEEEDDVAGADFDDCYDSIVRKARQALQENQHDTG